jgi:hypothetical protein
MLLKKVVLKRFSRPSYSFREVIFIDINL